MSRGKTVDNPIDDRTIETILRPTSFDEYIGQERIKKNIQTILIAAQKRNEPVEHMLLYGQAGLGKTTLANIIAAKLGSQLKVTSGTVIDKTADLAAILSSLEAGDVLFIDEVHRLNRAIEEMLYPAMESRLLHLVIGKGPAARMLTLDLPPFTLIAATTRVNLLSSPLRSRFGATFKLDYYTNEDIKKIVGRSASLLKIDPDDEAVQIIAHASRYTPRTANRLLRRVRDVAQVLNAQKITKDITREALDMFEIDELGLEEHDRRLLRALVDKFNGGPVGLGSLAAALSEDKDTIEDVYEPFLIKMGLLIRTPSGRRATERAYKHLGLV